MSNIKFSSNLFLEVAEFNRFQKFMNDDGFKRHFLLNTDNFGLIKQANIPEIGNISVEDNFYVSKAGTPIDQIIVNKGFALDGDGNLILNYVNKNLSVPNDSLWYWVKIKYLQTSIESGTISIDNLGNCTGVGTEFTQILRGQPNFPSKIKFANSVTGNADEYEVVKVVSDTQMILQGDFTTETNLKYLIVGTFTPGFVVDPSDKNIFRYDDVEITLEPEISLNNNPPYVLNYEFFIARVRNNGINLSLQDKRVQWWQTEATNELNNLDRNLVNPLVGVENAKWDIPTSTRAKNWVELAWGFRFNSWTIDTSSKRISILIGQGGVYKDTSYFQNGNFDGWRIYSKDGKYQNIIDSIKTGTQIVITLDVLNPEDYTDGDLLFACPPYEEFEVRVRSDASILDVNDINDNSITDEPFPYPNVEEIHNFSINTPLARFQIPAQAGCYKYNLTFRYKIFNNYTDWSVFPDDIVGFYKEKSFDSYGNLNPNPTDRERSPYVGDPEIGFINICENYFSYNIFQNTLNTGDLYGVRTTKLTEEDTLIELRVSKDKRYQHYINDEEVFKFGTNIFINLKSFKDTANLIPCREGNTFILHFDQWLDLDLYKLRIVENYTNPASFNLLAEIDKNDTAYIRNNFGTTKEKGLMVTCTFNENGHWVAQYDSDIRVKGTVSMFADVPSDAFDATSKEGIKAGYIGWKMLTDMSDTFPMGTTVVADTETPGGSNLKTIAKENLPNYNLTGTTDAAGSHTHNSVALHNAEAEYDPSNKYTAAYRSEGGDAAYGLQGTATTPSSGVTDSNGSHTHGITIGSGGSGTQIDIRPKYLKFIFAKKIV